MIWRNAYPTLNMNESVRETEMMKKNKNLKKISIFLCEIKRAEQKNKIE